MKSLAYRSLVIHATYLLLPVIMLMFSIMFYCYCIFLLYEFCKLDYFAFAGILHRHNECFINCFYDRFLSRTHIRINAARPDSLLRLWRYVNLLLAYLLDILVERTRPFFSCASRAGIASKRLNISSKNPVTGAVRL